jgi:hypothetical protein
MHPTFNAPDCLVIVGLVNGCLVSLLDFFFSLTWVSEPACAHLD